MIDLDPIETIPFAMNADGVLRVGGTRVTLDTILEAYREGLTPEQIADQYSSVPLGDIYEVIGYSLRHPGPIEAYLAARSELAQHVREENERRWPGEGLRQKLLSRRESAE